MFNKCYRPSRKDSSVHYGSTFRFEKAKEQAKLKTVPINEIIKYTNEVLKKNGIEPCNKPKVYLNQNGVLDDEYYIKIKNNYSLKSKKDIIWMKFTTDKYLGVVATSSDVNVKMPNSRKEYNLKKKNKWFYNTSGIIINSLGKKWNKDYVLIFPLKNLPNDLSRHDVEKYVGDYLIEKDVPILDYYSHRY